jgi:large subunit ribosomal protein L22
MEFTHHTRNLRIAPRKLRLVSRTVVHKPAAEALLSLALINKKGAPLLAKAVKAAMAMAADQNLDQKSLVIQRILCNEGPRLKRFVGRSRGRITRIEKQYSHLALVMHGDPRTAARRRVKATPATPEEVKSETTPATNEQPNTAEA